jgi:nitrogen fixation/metabolism regulation signal transduction histidine kinase
MFPNQRKGKKQKYPHKLARFETRLLYSVLLAGLPGVALALLLLWTNAYGLDHKLEGTFLLLLFWLILSFSAQELVINSTRALSNVIAALKEEDFSFRASRVVPGDALGDLAIEINQLARALETERIGTMETVALLTQVMAAAGAVILAFSMEGKVRLLNRAGAVLLGASEEQILQRTARELGIQDLFEGPATETIFRPFGNRESRWIVRRTHFRLRGVPHRLVVLSEASEALRTEERLAWQRIIRVLSHEVNNSLAPIKSIARTLLRITGHVELPQLAQEDFRHGLEVIGSRAESLNQFLQNYARLAKLPAPQKRTVSLSPLMFRVAAIESRLPVTVEPGPDVAINVDPAQLEQAMINLIQNAVDAVLAKSDAITDHEKVHVAWHTLNDELEIAIIDTGIGLTDTDNLFVPFYTTKPSGSGIGLALSRQIVEAHGGRLTIRNRTDQTGCAVYISLPMHDSLPTAIASHNVSGRE